MPAGGHRAPAIRLKPSKVKTSKGVGACVVPLLIVVDADPVSACKGKIGEWWVELENPTVHPLKNYDRRDGPRT